MKYILRKFDMVLVVCGIVVVVIGLMMIYSATVRGGELSQEFIRQSQMALVGIGVFILFSAIDSRLWFNNSFLLYILAVGLLACVLLLGSEAKGAQRWITIGPLGTFQPSEPAKLLLILVISKCLAGPNDGRFGERNPNWRKVVFTLGIIAVPMVLVLKQPDLGTAVLIAFVGAAMLFVSGVSWKWFFGLGSAAALILPHILHDYQRERITVFLNPENDPQGAGWNIIQSKIAIGSGGFWGKGFLLGTQNRLNFVPEHHTDFIFTVIGEETGFMGGFLLLFVLACLVFRAFWTAKHAVSPFESYVAFGIGASLAIHTIVNVGMTMGIMPVVGVPLPFISYGGSAILTNMASLGILNNLTVRCMKAA